MMERVPTNIGFRSACNAQTGSKQHKMTRDRRFVCVLERRISLRNNDVRNDIGTPSPPTWHLNP